MKLLACRYAFAVAAVFCGLASTSPVSAMSRLDEGAVVLRASGIHSDGVGAGTIVGIVGTTVRIITAKHVATFGALTVRFGDGERFPAHIVESFATRDLAIIEAEAPPEIAATLHAAPLAEATSRASVHVWGSGLNGPSFEPASTDRIGAPLPDGAAHGRFAMACTLCHEGDSGAGVFDEQGRLVGVYIGYFAESTASRVSVAETADAAVVTLARLNSHAAPSTSVAVTDARANETVVASLSQGK